jgi:hypothetical protein
MPARNKYGISSATKTAESTFTTGFVTRAGGFCWPGCRATAQAPAHQKLQGLPVETAIAQPPTSALPVQRHAVTSAGFAALLGWFVCYSRSSAGFARIESSNPFLSPTEESLPHSPRHSLPGGLANTDQPPNNGNARPA